MINQRLKQLRSENDLTQANLAKILGIAKTTLAAYEQGKSEPNIETLIKMANHFQVSVDYLIGKTSCMHEEYQPITDLLGVDEETIKILQQLSSTTSNYSLLDYLEAIIQHPHFSVLMSHVASFVANDTQGWHDVPIYDSNGKLSNTITADIMKASSMQLIQNTLKGIIESLPYAKHFSNKK